MKFEWEVMDDPPYAQTKRANVIGGWIVVHRELWDDNKGEVLGMVFIPDPEHLWEVEDEK